MYLTKYYCFIFHSLLYTNFMNKIQKLNIKMIFYDIVKICFAESIDFVMKIIIFAKK